MASGWGILGNKGRSYNLWTDFSKCMSNCTEPKDCFLLNEDDLECPHHAKDSFQKKNGIWYADVYRFQYNTSSSLLIL
ncbi:hypothetical protein MKW92_021785 [Papaver armeniacum]|nr:hypothetical protein MKW92_021785 [Papaver armeniacum]